MWFKFYLKLNVQTYISGVLDLFLPLKNSGKARLSISCILKKKSEYANYISNYEKVEWAFSGLNWEKLDKYHTLYFWLSWN